MICNLSCVFNCSSIVLCGCNIVMVGMSLSGVFGLHVAVLCHTQPFPRQVFHSLVPRLPFQLSVACSMGKAGREVWRLDFSYWKR